MDFNIFKVLEKDCKEFYHSPFLKFLLEENKQFQKDFLKQELGDDANILIDKSYAYRLNKQTTLKKIKFDIEIIDDDTIILINNRFMSITRKYQLEEYERVLNRLYPNHKHIKILLTFDKNVIKPVNGWRYVDYRELLPKIKKTTKNLKLNDQRVFVNNYHTYIKGFYENYDKIDDISVKYFLNQDNNECKFWVNLIFHNLALRLETYYERRNIPVSITLNPPRVKTPIITIMPEHWKFDDNQLSVQIQNGNFKFYVYSKDKKFVEDIREFSQDFINKEIVRTYPDHKKDTNTAIVFSINIHKNLDLNSKLTKDELFKYILLFYLKLDAKLVKKYWVHYDKIHAE